MKQLTIGKQPRKDYYVQMEIDRLRVNVGFIGADKKVIMMTSSEPNEGKSFISTCLWTELAKAGKNVCLVDADMRKSVLRNELQIQSGSASFEGLSHYLAGNCEIEDIIYSTNIENAYLVPTTTLINPSLLLEGERLDQLFALLRERFDYVIVDTPPMGMVSDGQLIAGKCDGCILVVRAHKTGRAAVRNSVMQLERVNCQLFGTVLNRMENKRAGRYYRGYYSKGYYSRGYYYYYSNASSASKGKGKEKGNTKKQS